MFSNASTHCPKLAVWNKIFIFLEVQIEKLIFYYNYFLFLYKNFGSVAPHRRMDRFWQ